MPLTVQSILQEHFEAFAETRPLAPYQLEAARQLRDCRTAAMGGHWRSCPEGHVHTPHYNSCHHRNCPQCAALARERWLDAWKERLLDCPHSHSVLTTPQDLIPLWRYNKKPFADLLFHAATDTLRELLAYLRKALEKGKLVLPPDLSLEQAQSLLNRLGREVWNVKIFDPYEHGRGVATYLARYLKGGPLSNGRLVDCRDGVVRFWYWDNRDEDEQEGGGRRKILSLPVDEFLSRLLEQVTGVWCRGML